MLGDDPIIALGFTYHDGADEKAVDKGSLLEALSTGEKKALYVLNVIFEVETRRKARQETLFVVDDIANSFDYQNKYAIIQYLKDTSQDPLFKQIIMTHNFDFFRTLVACRMNIISMCECGFSRRSTSTEKVGQFWNRRGYTASVSGPGPEQR